MRRDWHALENEIAILKSSLADYEQHVGDGWCPKPAGWYANVDYLNWKARRDMLDYATFDPGDEDIPQGPLVSLAFGAKSGVRGRLGHVSTCGWDLGVVYTYFRASVRGAVSVPTGSNELTPILSSPYDAALLDVDRASASADIDYSVVDFEVGHPWHVGSTLTGRCFASFRWAAIDQDFNVLYEGNDTGDGEDGYSVHAPINFDGYGLRLGGEAQWNVYSCFGIFASGAVSVLIGDFDTRYVLIDGDDDRFDANLSNDFQRVIPVMDVAVGANWVRGALDVSGGFELANWFNLIDGYTFPDDEDPPRLMRTPGDLGFYGFFLKAAVTF